MTKRTTLTLLLFAAGLFVVAPALAQDLAWYAQADQIGGCSAAAGHTGWIEVDAIHHLWFKAEGPQANPSKKELILTS